MEPNKDLNTGHSNLESESDNSALDAQKDRQENEAEDTNYASEDKYLAMEQPGISYTPDEDPMRLNSDHLEMGQQNQNSDLWDSEGGNSRNSEAFNQDEYLLRDNVDLDEDQSQSISSEDDIDTNTTDEAL